MADGRTDRRTDWTTTLEATLHLLREHLSTACSLFSPPCPRPPPPLVPLFGVLQSDTLLFFFFWNFCFFCYSSHPSSVRLSLSLALQRSLTRLYISSAVIDIFHLPASFSRRLPATVAKATATGREPERERESVKEVGGVSARLGVRDGAASAFLLPTTRTQIHTAHYTRTGPSAASLGE